MCLYLKYINTACSRYFYITINPIFVKKKPPDIDFLWQSFKSSNQKKFF